jgi:hypothetical protein
MYKLSLLILGFLPFVNVWGFYSSRENVVSQPVVQNLQTPAQEDVQQNWDVFADLLYWHVGEVGTIPNSTISTKLDPDLVSKLKLNNLDFGWDFGSRIGGRYGQIGEDQWGIFLSYTWFRSEAKNSGSYNGFVGIPTGFPLTQAITDASFFELFWLFAAQSYHAKWVLNYNVIDLEVDRQYAVSEAVSLRPHLGIRNGWIDQDIHIYSTYHDVLNHDIFFPAKETLKNHFWGIGPNCGLDTKWCLGETGGHSFYFFGDLSAAFLWSLWTYSDHLSIGDTIAGTLKSKHRQSGSLMFQNLLGFEWSVKLNRRGALFSLRLGFESQFWFDHLQIFNAYNGRQHNALTLQGGTFDLRFSY